MMKKRRRNLEVIECWLYAVASPADLARRLETAKHPITAAELSSWQRTPEISVSSRKRTKAGKSRQIQEPKRRLQWIHGKIHALLSRVEVPEYLHSAVRGRSYISNAAAHDPSMPMIKIDVKKFFASVPRVAIFNFFAGPMKCRRDVAGLLADMLTFDAHLPTGSAASPIIAFYAFKPMFDEIEQFALAHGLKMTCYVDDMALSGPRANKAALFEVRKIIARHGLKSHKAHVFAATQPKVVTGVCNTPAGPRVPNKLHLKIKTGFEIYPAATTADARKEALASLAWTPRSRRTNRASVSGSRVDYSGYTFDLMRKPHHPHYPRKAPINGRSLSARFTACSTSGWRGWAHFSMLPPEQLVLSMVARRSQLASSISPLCKALSANARCPISLRIMAIWSPMNAIIFPP